MTKIYILRFLDRIHLLTLAKDLYPALKYAFGLRTHLDNYCLRRQWPAECLPLPPPRLIYLVTDEHSIKSFLAKGVLGAQCIRGILARNGLDIGKFQSILDFGCGCGRVIRHWNMLPECQVYGTDYNPSHIEWCRRALGFAQFSVNQLNRPLEYKDGLFDFVYAISVFTHLDLSGQRFWMNELLRVLRRGGYLYLTVHGTAGRYMTPEEAERFAAGNPVVIGERHIGSNACGAFSPEPYVRKVMAKDFIVVDFVPQGAKDAGNQDVYLFQKPTAAFQ